MTETYKLSEDTFLWKTKDIHDYSAVMNGLYNEFGGNFLHTILVWRNLIDDDLKYKDTYWQVYLINYNHRVVGICGLYSLKPESKEELWLGWFGIVPELRNLGIGKLVLDWMKFEAKRVGASSLKTYVDVAGKPLNFYYRNGFERKSNVKELLETSKYSKDQFENEEDHVLEFLLCQR